MQSRRRWLLSTAVGASALAAPSIARADDCVEDTLDRIKRTGKFTLGVRDATPPYGYKDANGEYVGFATDIARKQDAALVAKVKALNLKGIYEVKEFKRFYPDNQIAAQVLGYVGIDDNGLGAARPRGRSFRLPDSRYGTRSAARLREDAPAA